MFDGSARMELEEMLGYERYILKACNSAVRMSRGVCGPTTIVIPDEGPNEVCLNIQETFGDTGAGMTHRMPRGIAFDRSAMNYNFAQTSLLAEARLISIINCLSEIPDHRGFECHLRYLTRLTWNPQLVICADSAAKKRRPRMSWLREFFDNADNFQSSQLFSGVRKMTLNWLSQGPTSQRIFRPTAPRWENSMSRWVYIRRVDQV